MTPSAIISQTFQAAAITPLKRDLAADTSAIAFNVSVTAGATPPSAPVVPLKLYYAASTVDLAAAAAPAALAGCAKQIAIPMPTTAAGVKVVQADFDMPAGGHLYLWSDAPALDQAVTLNVDLVEA